MPDLNAVLFACYAVTGCLMLISILAGFIRGSRKSLIYFIFYLIGLVVLLIISIPISQIVYSQVLSSNILPVEVNEALANEHVGDFVGSLCKMLIRFAVIIALGIVAKILLFIPRRIVWVLFFRGNKEEYRNKPKNRGMGAFIGLLKGTVAIIVFFLPISFFGIIVGKLDLNFDSAPSHAELSLRSDLFGLTSATKLNKEMITLEESTPTEKRTFDPDLGLDNEYVTLTMEAFNAFNKSPLFKVIETLDRPIVNAIFGCTMGEGENKGHMILTNEIATFLNVYLLLEDEGLFESNGENNVSMLQKLAEEESTINLSSQDVSLLFDYLSESQMIATLIPVGIEYGLTTAEKDIQKDDPDFKVEIDYNDIYVINWKNELTVFGNVASYALEAAGGDLEKLQSFKLDNMNLDKLSDAIAELSKSKAVTKTLSVALDCATRTEGFENFAKLMNVEGMDEEAWSHDINIISEIIDEYANIDSLDPDVIGSNFEDFINDNKNTTALKNIVGKVFDLKLISTKQDAIVETLFTTLLDSFDFIDVSTIDFRAVTDGLNYQEYISKPGNTEAGWNKAYKDEMMGFIDVLKDAAPLLNLNTDEGIASIDFDKLDKAITSITKSKTLNQVVDKIARDQFSSMSLGEIQIVIPENVDWSVEGHSLCVALKEAQVNMDKNDIAISIIKVDVDKLLASKIISKSFPSVLESDSLSSVLTIPSEIEWDDKVESGVKIDGELRRFIVSLQTIINNVDSENKGLTMGTLGNEIGVETIANMSSSDVDKTFNSDIIVATVSKFVCDVDAITIPISSYTDSTKTVIKKNELKSLVNIANDLEILGTNGQIDGSKLKVGLILKIEAEQLNCDIFRATISDQIINNAAGALIIPDKAKDTNGYILKEEILGLKSTLGPTKFNLIDGNDDLDTNRINSGLLRKVDADVLNVAIMHATISNQVILAEGDELIIPNIVGFTAYDEEGYIGKTELLNLKESLETFELIDDDGIKTSNINAGIIKRIGANSNVLDSVIMHATISKQITDNGGAGKAMLIPNLEGVCDAYNEYGYIDKQEMINLSNTVVTLNLINEANEVAIINFSLVKSWLDDSTKSQVIEDSKIIHFSAHNAIEEEINSLPTSLKTTINTYIDTNNARYTDSDYKAIGDTRLGLLKGNKMKDIVALM